MSETYGCYRCGFNHDTGQTCHDARQERHTAYAEECKRIIQLTAESRRADDTEDQEATNG